MARALKKIGSYLQKLIPGRKLAITELSKKGGGKLCFQAGVRGKKKIIRCHASHRNGIDADIRYLWEDEEQFGTVINRRTGRLDSSFLPNIQWKLLKGAFATGDVDLVLVGPQVKKALCAEARKAGDYKSVDQTSEVADILRRIYPDRNHNDHLHLRVKCSEDNPRCEKMDYKKKPVGC
jgi:penicillin-insensitive murein endopeptidase